MSMSMKWKIGLFGFLMHVGIVVLFLLARATRGERLEPVFLLGAIPLFLLSSYLVYVFVVSRYVEKREGVRNPVVIDSLIGILAELIIFTITAVLFGLYDGFRTGGGAESGLFGALLTGVLMNILWAYATFMVHILVIGNLCGLAGWYMLKKTARGR